MKIEQSPFRFETARSEKLSLQLAPDAKVYVTGQRQLKFAGSEMYRIPEEDITDITINNNINSQPSTASFTIVAPRHDENKYYNKGYFFISTMLEVKIYMKGRFLKKNGTEFEPKYYVVFWGIITSVQKSYSGNNISITVECADMLRWYEIMRTNVNPSAATVFFNPKVQMNLYSKRFGDMSPFEIVYELLKITNYDVQTPSNMMAVTQGSNVPNDAQRVIFEENSRDLINFWAKRFSQIEKSFNLIGFDGGSVKQMEKKHPSEIGTNTQHSSIRSNAGLQLSGDNLIDKFQPYAQLGHVSLYGAETQSHLEIINEIKDKIDFEFFQDTNGSITFKPRFYNIDVRRYDNQVIDDIDIISDSVIENESEIVTAIDVQAVPANMMINNSSPETAVCAFYTDYKLARKYGMRIQVRQNDFLRTPEQAFAYAISEVDRINTMATQGNITIMGRPELRLGYPIYIKSHDMFAYVTGVSHNFTFGGTFTTNITFCGLRRRYISDNSSFNKTREDGSLYAPNIIISTSTVQPETKSDHIDQIKTNLIDELEKNKKTKKSDETNDNAPESYKVKPEKVIIVKRVNGKLESFEEEQPVGTAYNNPVMNDTEAKRSKCDINENKKTIIKIGMSNEEQSDVFSGFLNMSDIIKLLQDKIPVSDSDGYELTGAFPYGSSLEIDKYGWVIKKIYNEISNFKIDLSYSDTSLYKSSEESLKVTYMKADDLSKASEFLEPEDELVSLTTEAESSFLNFKMEPEGVSLANMQPDNAEEVEFPYSTNTMSVFKEQ